MRREEGKGYPLIEQVLKEKDSTMDTASLMYRDTLLEAQKEAMPDGMLVVDPTGRIVTYNQRFVSLWNIPKAILDAEDNAAALRHAATLVADPCQFLREAEEILTSDAPCSNHTNLIPLKDGKLIERYGKAVIGPDGTAYGCAWYFRDITEQHRQQQELTRQINRFQNTLEGISDAFVSLDHDGTILFANRKAAALGLATRDEIIGKSIWEAFPKLQQSPLRGLVSTCLQTREPAEVEYHSILSQRWLSIKIYPTQEELSIFATDITEVKKAEEGLRKSEDQYRSFADSLPQLAWMARADGWIHWYNERWYEYTGTTLEDMQGWGWEQVHHPDHIGRVLPIVKEAWQRDEPWELTFPLRRHDGEYRWFLTRAYPVKDEAGRVLYWIGTNTDIHAQLETEKALKQSEMQLRRLADFVPQIVWATDQDGDHDFFNKRWYEFTGLTYLESKNKAWSMVLHPEDRERTLEVWNHSLQTGELYEMEYRMRRHDGEYRWLLARAMPLRDASGKIDRWFGTCTDIHDQKILADTLEAKVKERTGDLQEANNNLKQINEELRQFNYIVSHDLQEPIRKIRIFSDRIKRQDYEQLQEPSRLALDKIIHSADHLSVLFKDLLDFIGVQREMHFTCVDLNEIVSYVEIELEPVIAQRKATIVKEALPTLRAIPLHMHQLFHNLISNALKFTAADTTPVIRISCNKLPAHEVQSQGLLPERRYYHIVVEDNGIGFEQEFADRIFVLFKRLHSQAIFKGTGVGLALCKKVVDNHQGRIWAESEPGKGAAFHLILPSSV
jgi:PAS domain S-box-containing protein